MNYRIVLIVCLLFSLNAFVLGQEAIDTARVNEVNSCLKCHSGSYYTFYNTVSEEDEKRKLSADYFINKSDYNNGVHGSFACTDCHVPDFEEYPHVPDAKMEMKYSCLDCHGDDEDYAEFHFDEISEEVNASVHVQNLDLQFKCESCHNPHSYQFQFRNELDLEKVIENNNRVCLSCHNDSVSYLYYTENEMPNLATKHDWLPNQSLHYKKVRCIECHSERQEERMVAHKILPKENAVKKCAECHSSNSMLIGTLYKNKNIELRSKYGFYNATILNNAYVIGANRNGFLNILSVLLFGLTFLGILVHIVFRIIYKREK